MSAHTLSTISFASIACALAAGCLTFPLVVGNIFAINCYIIQNEFFKECASIKTPLSESFQFSCWLATAWHNSRTFVRLNSCCYWFIIRHSLRTHCRTSIAHYACYHIPSRPSRIRKIYFIIFSYKVRCQSFRTTFSKYSPYSAVCSDNKKSKFGLDMAFSMSKKPKVKSRIYLSLWYSFQ